MRPTVAQYQRVGGVRWWATLSSDFRPPSAGLLLRRRASPASRRCWRSASTHRPRGSRSAHHHRLRSLHGRQRHDLRGPDRHRQGPAGRPRASPNPGPYRRTARPIRSSSAPGVKFHDGAPMEADDVVASIKRVQSKDIASPLASRLAAVDSATAVDPQTVELKLKEPSAPLLASLATLADRAARSVETDKDALQKAAGRHRPVQVSGMAAERLHPALAHRRLLAEGPAEARRPEVQHRAGIGHPPGRPRQRPIRAPAEHRRGDGPAAQGQAGREARRDAGTRLFAHRHERVEAAFRQSQGA